MKKINPITKRDLTITSRSMRFSWGLFAYEGILMLVFLIALSILGGAGYADSNAQRYSSFIALYPVVATAEICIVALIIPIITASSIAGEKERQTFDIMLTTRISPMQIVTGKILSAVVRVMTYVLASVPIMAIGFTIGGVSWLSLFFFLLLTLLLALFEGAIGVFCSSVCKKSITAIIMSYIVIFAYCMMGFVPLILGTVHFYMTTGTAGSLAEKAMTFLATVFLLPNPVFMFVEFFGSVITGDDFLAGELLEENLPGLSFLGKPAVWITIAAILILLFTFCFMKLSAYIINPLHHKNDK